MTLKEFSNKLFDSNKDFYDNPNMYDQITSEQGEPATGERSHVEQQAEEDDVQLPKEVER